MNLIDLIRSRRTVKDYDGSQVSREEIMQIIEAGNWAPNHRLNQPWRFRVVEPKSYKSWLEAVKTSVSPDEWNGFQKPIERLHKSGALVFVTSLKDDKENVDRENYAAVSACIQNMLLMAESMKIQTYWSTAKLFLLPATLTFTGIKPAQEHLVGVIWLGKGGRVEEVKARKAASDLVTFI